jgi:hypothetical protein
MHAGRSLLLCLLLSGCSLGGYVDDSSFEYNQTLADVANQQLVINILRARDNVPLEFSDLSQIRGSIQASASLQANGPFGPLRASSTRGGSQGMASIQLNPTFDIAPLNTQDFTRGTLQPIDVNYLNMFYNQGVAWSVLLPLFLSSIEEHAVGADGKPVVTIYQNIPCPTTGCPESDFAKELRAIFSPVTRPEGNYLWSPVIHTYNELIPVGRPAATIDPKSLPGSSSSAGSPQFEIKPATIPGKGKGKSAGGSQLYQVKTHTAICRGLIKQGQPEIIITQYQPLEDDHGAACSSPEVIKSDNATPAKPKPGTITYKFNMRSVQDMIQYLGQTQLQAEPSQRQIDFDLADRKPANPADIRIEVVYKGTKYYAKQGHLLADLAGNYSLYDDDTMRVLSIVSEMLNVYKNASEIPATKAVQAVP